MYLSNYRLPGKLNRGGKCPPPNGNVGGNTPQLQRVLLAYADPPEIYNYPEETRTLLIISYSYFHV